MKEKCITFAIGFSNVVFKDADDQRNLADWFMEETQLPPDAIETFTNGIIYQDKVVLAEGIQQDNADLEFFDIECLVEVMCKHNEVFGECPVKFYTGLAEDNCIGTFTYSA